MTEQKTVNYQYVKDRRMDKSRFGRQWIQASFFLGPNLIFYTIFLIFPLIGTFVLSLTDWNGFNISSLRITGLQNYQTLLRDADFWVALGHNAVFLLANIIISTGIALGLAILFEERLPFSKFFRAIFLVPTVLSFVVIGIVFKLGFSPTLGFVNPFLRAVGLGQLAGEWLGDANRVLPVLIGIDIWHMFGLYMFLFIARLITIPEELHEAAWVDGAGWFQQLRYVTLPLIRSTIVMVIMLAAINSLKLFALVQVMTNGGPGHASEVLSTYAYFQAFTGNKVGYGSAIQVVLLVVTFVIALVQSRLTSEEVD